MFIENRIFNNISVDIHLLRIISVIFGNDIHEVLLILLLEPLQGIISILSDVLTDMVPNLLGGIVFFQISI